MAKNEYDDGLDASFIIDQARGRHRRLGTTTDGDAEAPPQDVPVRRESKRKRGQDYETLFITDAPMNTRCGKTVYIRAEYHERLTKIVQTIGRNKISLYSYLDNVLSHHFDTYHEEITALYKERNSDIF